MQLNRASQSERNLAVAKPPVARVVACRSPAEVTAEEFIVFQDGRRVLKEQLTPCKLRWFEEISGLSLHAVWHGPLEFQHQRATPLICPTACHRRKGAAPVPPLCQLCSEQRWARALKTATGPKCFAGRCGSANCCAALAWESTRPLTLVLQVRIPPKGRPTKHADADAIFQRAVTFLRLLHHDMQTSLQNRLFQDELGRARLRVRQLEAEGARRRKEVPRHIPGFAAAPVGHAPGSHASQIVQMMLDYTLQHYQSPMSLRDLAAHLNMNANYLSDLFHKTTGVTFHHYLDDLRLGKAEELLRDPRVRVCEVACAVGYASPNHFRNVFKAHKGHPPNVWRESLPQNSPEAGR